MQLLYTEQDNKLQCIQFAFAFVSYVRKSDVQHRKFLFVVYAHFDLSRLRLEFTPAVIVDAAIISNQVTTITRTISRRLR